MTLNEVCAVLKIPAQTGTLSKYLGERIPLTAENFSPKEWTEAIEYLADV